MNDWMDDEWITLLQKQEQHIQIINKARQNKELQCELEIEASKKLLRETPAFAQSEVDLLSIYKIIN